MNENKFWTVPETASLLRCSERTIITYIREGKLKNCSHVGGKWLIPIKSIQRLLDENGTKEFKVSNIER